MVKTGCFLNKFDFQQITEKLVKLLESPIKQLEVDKAILALQPCKCPGADGFPVELLKVIQGKISNLLFRGFNKSFEELKLLKS